MPFERASSMNFPCGLILRADGGELLPSFIQAYTQIQTYIRLSTVCVDPTYTLFNNGLLIKIARYCRNRKPTHHCANRLGAAGPSFRELRLWLAAQVDITPHITHLQTHHLKKGEEGALIHPQTFLCPLEYRDTEPKEKGYIYR